MIKEGMKYIHDGILLSHKNVKSCHLPQQWMNPEENMLNEVRESDKT